jgi:hypothetical protein
MQFKLRRFFVWPFSSSQRNILATPALHCEINVETFVLYSNDIWSSVLKEHKFSFIASYISYNKH